MLVFCEHNHQYFNIPTQAFSMVKYGPVKCTKHKLSKGHVLYRFNVKTIHAAGVSIVRRSEIVILSRGNPRSNSRGAKILF